MKTNKAKKITKIEKKKTTSELTSEEDYGFREFVQKQKRYKEVFLSRLYKGAELKEVRNQLESGKITMKWYGQIFPRDILVIEHDIIQTSYYDLIGEEEQLKRALINDGMSKAELKALLQDNKLKKTYKNKKIPSYFG